MSIVHCRTIIRILQLGKRLHGQLHSGSGSGGLGGQEVAKAALSLHELSQLWSPELNGIEVVEQDQRVILHAKADVERNADGMLARGLEARNQNQVGVALQVFKNLSVLDDKLKGRLKAQLSHVKSRLAEALEVKAITSQAEEAKSKALMSTSGGASGSGGGPGRSTMPAPGNMATFRGILWNNLETVLDVVYDKSCEVVCLQRLLCKKRDTVTHSLFFELLPEQSRQLLANFWNGVVKLIDKRLAAATAESNFLRQALEGEYPKLLRLFNDLWSRLHGVGTEMGRDDSKNPFLSSRMDVGLRETLCSFERAYLSRSLSRLFDPVNLMFSSSSSDIPSESDLHQVFKGVASELNVSSVDAELSATVAKNVAKTVRLVCVKFEQILVTDGEASQVVGRPTDGQKKNVAVVNSLGKFKDGIEDIVRGESQAVTEALQDVHRLIMSAVSPLLLSIGDSVEAVVLTMHGEDFSAEDIDDDAKNCSLYMKELQGFLSRVSVDFLSEFSCRRELTVANVRLASTCVDQFILHASLTRPLGRSGQMRLASDCAQLELALEPLVGKLDSDIIGGSYSRLRAFRSLLFLCPEDVPTSPLLGRALPYSTALHFLFAKAPAELKSPHDSAGWSLSRYSAWLEDHPTERERLQLMQGTLESYVAATRARKEKAYAQPYPIMLKLLEDGLKMTKLRSQ